LLTVLVDLNAVGMGYIHLANQVRVRMFSPFLYLVVACYVTLSDPY
jgi:DMSO/TMAO reductase YedYZ heme-binding membrane subunit